MKIGIVGGGVVGHALARCYSEFAEVMMHDVIHERSTHSLQDTLDVGWDGVVFVCLPTPQRSGGGGLDIRLVEEFFANQVGSTTNFVLRSTVPIGTTRYIKAEYGIQELVYSPEFLTSRCAIQDAALPSRNIIGGQLNGVSTNLSELYARRFPGIQTIFMGSDAAEAVKLFTNAFFAVKIAFFNEIRSTCDKLGIQWNTVLWGMLSDGRISAHHTQVPGPDGNLGFGGSCLPKDLAEVIDAVESVDVQALMTSAAAHRNEIDRGTY